MLKIFTFCLFFHFTISQTTVFQKYMLGHPEALCMDGTPGAYYIAKGTNPQKIVLFYQGGDWCGGPDLNSALEDCYQLSRRDGGSSRSYPDQIGAGIGILSNFMSNHFADATKVWFKYCDGGSHQGYRKTPINYKGVNIYFKGHIITQNQLDDLQARQGVFSRATEIYVTGQSAGGVAVFHWANYIRSRAQAPIVKAIVDSAIFMDAPTMSGQHYMHNYLTNSIKLTNVDAPLPAAECVNAHPGDQAKCYFAENLYMHVQVPLFAACSLYDSFAIPGILGVGCINGVSLQNCNSAQRNHIEQYHHNISTLLNQIGARSGQNGFWGISCAQHCLINRDYYNSPSYRIPMSSDGSLQAVLHNWARRDPVGHVYLDGAQWPNNRPCSGV